MRQTIPRVLAATRGVHWYVPALLSLTLVPLSFYSYLAFHIIAELFAITIAVCTFAVAWTTYPFSRNGTLALLGLGYFWVAVLDLVHTLLYKGMNIFPVLSANPATQLWLEARYAEALLLLAAPSFLRREVRPGLSFVAFGLVAVGLVVLVLIGAVPDAFVEGEGLTAFKVFSEYAIVALLLLALAHLWAKRQLLDERVVGLITAAILFTAMAELSFTLYVSVYGLSNLVGHVLKIFSYWAIFIALVEFTLTHPFRQMARGATTYDAIPDPTVVVDREGFIRQVNRAARDTIGVAGAQELLGEHVHGLFHQPELSPQVCPACTAVREGRAASAIELRRGERWCEITLSPVRRAGENVGAIHVARDITERKRSELERQRLTAELEATLGSLRESQMKVIQAEQSHSLGILSSGIANELNNPLMGVLNYVDYAENKSEGRTREVLRKAAREVRRVQEIIRKMLVFAGPAPSELGPVDVAQTLEQALQFVSAVLRVGHIEVRQEIQERMPPARARAEGMQQIMLNLILNARDAMEGRADKVLTLRAWQDGEWDYVQVQDTGEGMGAETLEHLHVPFFTTRPRRGAGLGLPLAMSIVNDFGGTIDFESEPEVGTTVTVKLPVWTTGR